MRSLTNYPVGGSGGNVILRNQSLNFTNLTAVIYDARVTESTLILVYYSEATEAAAQSAGITSETNNGNITFTAANTPSTTIVCDIVLLSEGSGGGGGGTSDYPDLTNKPSINGVELNGNKTTSDLGLQGELTFDNVPTANSTNPVKSGGIYDSEKDIYAVMGEMGAKNLIPYPYYDTTKTTNGITFTNNGDGTVTANGTATDTSTFSVVLGGTALSANGNLTINTNKPLILSGCPSGGNNNTYRIQYGLTDGTSYWAKTASDTGSGVELTPVDGLNSYCFDVIRVMVFKGCTVNNLTFKPMLRLASDTDDTYQPYAKTNRELTESYPANKVMMSDGVTSVESEINKYNSLIDNPLAHNGIYTGRNLGTINSASDWAAFRAKYGIADKSYKGLYLGDYVKVNDGTYNADWMVAGFNTETNKGSSNICPECVSMIPRVGDGCGTSYMNSDNVTTGGYKDSYMNTTKLPDVATKLTTIFGSNLVTRDIMATKTVTNGYASDFVWISCKCSLLTSVQVYGSLSFENTGGTYFVGYNIGEGYEKLPVFNFIHPAQFSHSSFWLRGVSSAKNFCRVNGYGHPQSNGASFTNGVRPLICLN